MCVRLPYLMTLISFGLYLTPVDLAIAGKGFEKRCGWFENPTPSNAWLNDREGQWIIGVQGGYQAQGDWPSFQPHQWVRTNAVSYGYGCACLQVKVNSKSHKIIQIKSSKAQSLQVCRRDRFLKEPI